MDEWMEREMESLSSSLSACLLLCRDQKKLKALTENKMGKKPLLKSTLFTSFVLDKEISKKFIRNSCLFFDILSILIY